MFTQQPDDQLNCFQQADTHGIEEYFDLFYDQRMFVIGLLIGAILLFSMKFQGFTATLLLFGLIPGQHIKSIMMSIYRVIIVIMYFTAIVMTLVLGIALQGIGLLGVFLVLRIITWFQDIVTSIPGEQTMCKYCYRYWDRKLPER
jgi:hypothetical protein